MDVPPHRRISNFKNIFNLDDNDVTSLKNSQYKMHFNDKKDIVFEWGFPSEYDE